MKFLRGGGAATSQHPQPPPPSFGTAAFDAGRGAGSEVSSNGTANAGSGVGAGVGEVTGPRSRHELSAWWLLVVVACLIAGAWLDGGMW